MIKISIYQNEESKIIGFRSEGHAGFSHSGQDIVCAAVSALIINTVNSIEQFTSDTFDYQENEKNGYIRRDPSKPRAIEIIDDEFNLTRRELVNVPIIGTITAGKPILAVESVESYFPIPAEYMPNEETFMLKVKGDSMINVGIYNGDKILVQKQNVAINGDIVVALIEDSVTVKTFYKEKGYYRLQPENDAMEPIIVTELNILGKVIGLFRLFQ